MRLDGIPHSIALYLRHHVNQLAQSTLGFAKVARLHYDADAKTLVITCPTFGHEILTAFPPEALGIINANNKEFYGGWKSDCRYHIVSSGSADIPFKARNGGSSIRQPDASLRLVTAEIPFLVCEMADSQSPQELKQRVQEYIIGTGGKVKIVIFIKLERTRPPSKRKRDMTEDDQEEELDRADGVANSDSGAEDEHVMSEANVPTGATELDGVGDHGAQADDDEDPVLPATLLPTRENYSRGVFWVYRLEYAPDRGADHATIKCLENEEEFYPTPPTTSLVLTWASILNRAQIPADILNRSVTIPYTVLYDLFAPLTSGLAPPPGVNARLKLNYDDDVLGPSFRLTKSEVSIPD
ncbi:hypothetical protein Q9L58_010507 [Maublancomyces gigas]|uniref:Uncharacterized protein n=1 Tax=Discina gigas TaxID=1032678 RepID=A0ABR3G3Y5_9PEZI